jgi:hypothetical protein
LRFARGNNDDGRRKGEEQKKEENKKNKKNKKSKTGENRLLRRQRNKLDRKYQGAGRALIGIEKAMKKRWEGDRTRWVRTLAAACGWSKKRMQAMQKPKQWQSQKTMKDFEKEGTDSLMLAARRWRRMLENAEKETSQQRAKGCR